MASASCASSIRASTRIARRRSTRFTIWRLHRSSSPRSSSSSGSWRTGSTSLSSRRPSRQSASTRKPTSRPSRHSWPAAPRSRNDRRNDGRYPESLQAYDEALRLRPNYPEALEYLGEAYVKLGRLDDARRVLDRLRPLDTGRAKELAEVIQKGK